MRKGYSLDLEIPIRRRTDAEVLAIVQEALEKACWFCGRQSHPYPMKKMFAFFNVKMCGHCESNIFSYRRAHFFEPKDAKRHKKDRTPYKFMSEEQDICSYLYKLNQRLKNEIARAEFKLRTGG